MRTERLGGSQSTAMWLSLFTVLLMGCLGGGRGGWGGGGGGDGGEDDDAGTPSARCGDGTCNGSENSSTCPSDCRTSAPQYCGRGGSPVTCGTGSCAPGSTCIGGTSCRCNTGSTAVHCDGRDCSDTNPCMSGEWYCRAATTTPPPPQYCGRGGSPVTCGTGTCAPGSACVDGTSCRCSNGYTAVHCDGRDCSDTDRCMSGEWYCRAPTTTPPPPPPSNCPRAGYGFRPTTPPVYTCNATSSTLNTIMQDINGFWGTSLIACSCGADARMVCTGNAFVDNRSPFYLNLDPNFLATLVNMFGGRIIAAAWVMAHEVGHSIQRGAGISGSFSIQTELGADCFAGYFLAYLGCSGRIDMTDVQVALGTACSGMDQAGTPWFAPGAHGTCQQRMQALARGVSGYTGGNDPLVVCRF